MNIISNLVDQVESSLSAVLNQPGGVRNTAVYQFLLQVKDRLVENDVPVLIAEQTVAALPVCLPADFHTEYPDEFERIVAIISTSLVQCHTSIVADFESGSDVLSVLAQSFNVNLQY